MCIVLEVVLIKLHAKLTAGWALIQENFDPIQEIGQKVRDGRSFVSGPSFVSGTFFATLQYAATLPIIITFQMRANSFSIHSTLQQG